MVKYWFSSGLGKSICECIDIGLGKSVCKCICIDVGKCVNIAHGKYIGLGVGTSIGTSGDA